MDILSYIQRINQLYGSEQQVARDWRKDEDWDDKGPWDKPPKDPFKDADWDDQVAGLSESFPGTYTSYQDAVSGGFQGTMEDWLQQQSIPQIDRPFTGQAGGRVYDTRKYFKPGGLVEPGVTHYGKKTRIDTDTLIKILNESKDLTDNQTADKLNKKYLTERGKTFDADNIFQRRKTLGIKTDIIDPNPISPERQKAMSKFLAKEVRKANQGDKFVRQVDLMKKAVIKFEMIPQKEIIDKRTGKPKGLTRGIGEGVRYRLDTNAYPVLKTLETSTEKIDEVLKRMLMDEKPLDDLWYRVVQKKTGLERKWLGELLRSGNVPTYNVIKDQGADFISNNFSKHKNLLKDLSFSDQLSKATRMKEGRPVLSIGGEFSRGYNRPKFNVFRFAFQEWDQNRGQGDIKFFDKPVGGNEITWDYGNEVNKRLKNSSFSYKGKRYNLTNLDDTDLLKKNFKEVYERTLQATSFGEKKIENPFKSGSKIQVKHLIKKIQVDGYKWMPGTGTINILHGPLGVKGEPFTNLRYNTYDINKIESVLANKLNAEDPNRRISRSTYNKAMKELNSAFKGLSGKKYQGAIIKRLETQAKAVQEFKGKGEPLKIKTQVKSLLEKIGCPNLAAGGRVGFGTGGDCFKKGIEVVKNKNFKSPAQAKNMLKLAEAGARSSALRSWLGVYGLAGEAIIEAGIGAYKVLGQDVPADVAWAESYWSYLDPRKYRGELRTRRDLLKEKSPRAAKYIDALEKVEDRDKLVRNLKFEEDREAGQTGSPAGWNKKRIDAARNELNQYDEIIRNFYGGTKGLVNILNKHQAEFENLEAEQAGKFTRTPKHPHYASAERKRKLAMDKLMAEQHGMKRLSHTKDGQPIWKKDPNIMSRPDLSSPEAMADFFIDDEWAREVIKEHVPSIYGSASERQYIPTAKQAMFSDLRKDPEYNKMIISQSMMLDPSMLGTQERFNTGGRVPFGKAGAVDKGRRAFMKWLAGITGATVAAGTGLIKWGKFAGKGKTVIKAGDHIIQGTPGMPDWFIPLVNRIVKEGDDVTKKLGTVEREIVHTKKIGTGRYGRSNEEVTVYQNLDTGNVRVEYGGPVMDKKGNVIRASNDPEVVHLEYKAPEEITSGKHRGQKTKSEFSAAEAEPEVVNWDGDIEWSGINEVNKVDDLITDTSKLKQFATKKKPTMGEIVESSKKKKYQQKLQEDTMEQIDYIEKKRGPFQDPQSIDDILEQGKAEGVFDPKGYDTHNIWKGQNLPKEYNEKVIKEYMEKTKKASGGRVDYDNYLPDIEDID